MMQQSVPFLIAFLHCLRLAVGQHCQADDKAGCPNLLDEDDDLGLLQRGAAAADRKLAVSPSRQNPGHLWFPKTTDWNENVLAHKIYADEQEAYARQTLADTNISKRPYQLSDIGQGQCTPYAPSAYSFKYFVPPPATEGFARYSFQPKYVGTGKILVATTSHWILELEDGKSFATGHHTTELFVPMIHLADAGFDFIIATMDGAATKLEQWTFPIAGNYEAGIQQMRANMAGQIEQPRKFSDLDIDRDNIVGIFIPGGHGAMINLWESPDLGALLREAHARSLPTMSLCHGPISLAAASIGVPHGMFPYTGYKAVAFPDNLDNGPCQETGYLAARMTKLPQMSLMELGVNVVNYNATSDTGSPIGQNMDGVIEDRELITGVSQASAQKFGMAIARKLMAIHSPSSKVSPISGT